MIELASTRVAIIFDKPRGISCVELQAPARSEPTAVSLACAARPELLAMTTGAPGRPNEHGLLHRLDRDTTGCLAFARIDEGYAELKERWPQSEKIYRAIVEDPGGLWAARPTPLTFDWPLANSSKSAKRMLVLDPERPGIERSMRGSPLPAVTIVLEAKQISKSLFDLTLVLRTGVRHQIRAHLAALGTPLWGDPIYAKVLSPENKTYFLHSWQLTLPSHTSVEAPLPADWPRGGD